MAARNATHPEVPVRAAPIVSTVGLIALLAVVVWALFASDYYEEGGRFQREFVVPEATVEPALHPPATYEAYVPAESPITDPAADAPRDGGDTLGRSPLE